MRETVKQGYEEADYESLYRQGREIRPEEERLFEGLLAEVPEGGRILDLGYGT